MTRRLKTVCAVCALGAVATFALSTIEANTGRNTGRGNGPIIYVVSQDLFFDSIVTPNPLPF